MGMVDANLEFSIGQAITASAVSVYFLDLLTNEQNTSNYNNLPPATWGRPGTPFQFNVDWGIGAGKAVPRVIVNTGQAFATLTSLQIAFQGAPLDAGNTGLRSNLVFVTYIETNPIALSLLTANTRIASFDWPQRQMVQNAVRFVQLGYIVGGANATAGTINADVTTADDAQGLLQSFQSGFSAQP